jgi:hypothetical protein
MYEQITVVIIGMVFGYLYINEKDNLLKLVFLFTGLIILATGFFYSDVLTQTTESINFGSSTANAVITYNYIPDNALVSTGKGFAGFFLILTLIFLTRFLQEIIKVWKL